MSNNRARAALDWISRFADLVQFIIFIIIAISYFFSIKFFISLQKLSFSTLAIPSVFFLVALFIILRLKRKYILYPRPQSDFKLLEKEIIYQYLDEKHMRYTKGIRLKALKEGLDRYTDKYHWTGSGKVELSAPIPEQRVVQTVKRRVWQLYDVYFGRSLNKGDVEEIAVIWELYDEKGAAIPFASTIIDERLDLLKIKIILPVSLAPRQASCAITPSFGFSRPISSFTRGFNRRGELEWTIGIPKLWHTYEIGWELRGR